MTRDGGGTPRDIRDGGEPRRADGGEPRRDIPLERTYNLRDLGGYAVAGGGAVRWRTVLRGAGLHRLDGEDAELVRALGVRTAVDLRTEAEVAARGTWPAALLGGEVRRLPLIPRLWADDEVPPGRTAEAVLGGRYDEMLEHGGAAVAELFALLADPGRLPLVFFCTAGKDRTGIVAALVLEALGVARADVVADYALSAERVARMARRAGRPLPALGIAPPAVMEAFLARIDRRHGSVRGLLRDLGVGDDVLAAVRANLVA